MMERTPLISGASMKRVPKTGTETPGDCHEIVTMRAQSAIHRAIVTKLLPFALQGDS
jgi:hypothetical protein